MLNNNPIKRKFNQLQINKNDSHFENLEFKLGKFWKKFKVILYLFSWLCKSLNILFTTLINNSVKSIYPIAYGKFIFSFSFIIRIEIVEHAVYFNIFTFLLHFDLYLLKHSKIYHLLYRLMKTTLPRLFTIT